MDQIQNYGSFYNSNFINQNQNNNNQFFLNNQMNYFNNANNFNNNNNINNFNNMNNINNNMYNINNFNNMNNINNNSNNLNEIMMNLINQNIMLQNQMINMMMNKSNQQKNFQNEKKSNLPIDYKTKTIRDAFPGISGNKLNIVFENNSNIRTIIETPINVKIKDLLLEYLKSFGLDSNVINKEILFLYNGKKINPKIEESVSNYGLVDCSKIIVIDSNVSIGG